MVRKKKVLKVFNFPGPGVSLSMYNLDSSIKILQDLHELYSKRKYPCSTCLLKIQFLKKYDGNLKIYFKKFMKKNSKSI